MGNKGVYTENERYEPPSQDELRSVVSSLGGIGAVVRITKKNRATVAGWVNGTRRIDYANWKLISGILRKV